MGSMQRGLQLLRRSALNRRISPICRILTRLGSSGGGPPPPPIKPPGKEWINEGWKDDGTGHGDYPNWAEFSFQDRDPRPLEPYFDAQDRRYYGEPVHLHDDILNMWMPDSPNNYIYTPRQMLLHFCTALGILGLVIFYSEYIYDGRARNPAGPKVYPYNNLYLELGGDPEKEPTEEDLRRRIPTPHYGHYI